MESKLDDEEELSRCFELLSTSNVEKKARREAMDRIELASSRLLLTKTNSIEALVDVAKRDAVDSIRTRALQTLSNLFDSSTCTSDSVSAAASAAGTVIVVQLVCDRFSQESSEDNRSVINHRVVH